MILVCLGSVAKADFVFLLNATELSWGNLSSHVTNLGEAGYVTVEKGFVGRKPHTLVHLTATGRQAVDTYRHMRHAALGARRRWPARPPASPSTRIRRGTLAARAHAPRNRPSIGARNTGGPWRTDGNDAAGPLVETSSPAGDLGVGTPEDRLRPGPSRPARMHSGGLSLL
ncbi:MAG: transcriptional regulator [Actinomycetota bacterium]